MLFHWLVDGASYVVQARITLAGPLDARRLRGALGALVRRHPQLGVTIRHDDDGQPAQIPDPDAEVPWREVDLRHHGELADELARDRAEGFDLATGAAPARPAGPAGRRPARAHRDQPPHPLRRGSLPVLLDDLCALYQRAELPPAARSETSSAGSPRATRRRPWPPGATTWPAWPGRPPSRASPHRPGVA